MLSKQDIAAIPLSDYSDGVIQVGSTTVINSNVAAGKYPAAGIFPYDGGQLTGPLLLSEAPIDPMEAANKQWVTDSVTNAAIKLAVQVVGAAPAATDNFYLGSGLTKYFTTAASAAWIQNIAYSSGASLDSSLAVGQSVKCKVFATQGATPYMPSAFKIDGTSVTPKWITGTAPVAGNANAVDMYELTIVKTAAATFTIFASQSKYA